MTSKYGFTLLTPAEFATWLAKQSTSRSINHVQIHHTYLPNYSHFTGSNHFERQRAMKQSHMIDRGWADIGQHFTIFPDGKICTGRQLNLAPACISGHNTGGICIETFGNFDKGNDVMTPDQKNALLRTVGDLCTRYKLPIDSKHIVYHHWFDSTGARWTNEQMAVKSCPGTAFFGGNKVSDAETHFLPLIKTGSSITLPSNKLGVVKIDDLNVRKGPSVLTPVIRKLKTGDEVRITKSSGKWYGLLDGGWVASSYIQIFRRARVNNDYLNVRQSPSATAFQMDRLDRDAIVRVYVSESGWAKIGDDRWVKESYLKYL